MRRLFSHTCTLQNYTHYVRLVFRFVVCEKWIKAKNSVFQEFINIYIYIYIYIFEGKIADQCD